MIKQLSTNRLMQLRHEIKMGRPLEETTLTIQEYQFLRNHQQQNNLRDVPHAIKHLQLISLYSNSPLVPYQDTTIPKTAKREVIKEKKKATGRKYTAHRYTDYELTTREAAFIIRLVEAEGCYKKAAELMGISPTTAKTHCNNAFQKMQVSTKFELLLKVVREGLDKELGITI